MKLTLSFLITILFFTTNTHSQDFITIKEDVPLEVCGRTLMISGFYVNNYTTNVDIMNFMTPTSKPIIGGYQEKEPFNISKECEYLVASINKYSIKNPGEMEMKFGGEVVLSKTPIERDFLLLNPLIMPVGYAMSFGKANWYVKAVTMDTATIEIKNDTAALTFNLAKNAIVWFGQDAFYVSNFLAQATDDPDKAWTIELSRVKDLSYLTGESIPGELINSPHDLTLPSGDSWLIIRKMKFVPKKRVTDEELAIIPVKYWALQVYNYHGGIARPVIEVNTGGVKRYLEFDAYKSFDTESEALDFAKLNGVTDIILEEE